MLLVWAPLASLSLAGQEHGRTIPLTDIPDFCDAWGLGGPAAGYSPDWMALSSRKRISLSLLVSEITKRTRPWLEVSA